MSAPVQYRVVPHDSVLTFQWEKRGTDDHPTWAGTGDCPVCGCSMTVTYAYIQPPIPKGGFRDRREESDADVWYSSCRCASLHMPRPANVPAGCGAVLRLARPQATTGNGG
ncbi:hypothetical protein [Streptomyces sp. NPDC050538]|uniref:hypothetical protein n=1 Tax=Streptomyces sp. NPDC050538 TaxID=3365627 RepID=UPI0037A872A7